MTAIPAAVLLSIDRPRLPRPHVHGRGRPTRACAPAEDEGDAQEQSQSNDPGSDHLQSRAAEEPPSFLEFGLADLASGKAGAEDIERLVSIRAVRPATRSWTTPRYPSNSDNEPYDEQKNASEGRHPGQTRESQDNGHCIHMVSFTNSARSMLAPAKRRLDVRRTGRYRHELLMVSLKLLCRPSLGWGRSASDRRGLHQPSLAIPGTWGASPVQACGHRDNHTYRYGRRVPHLKTG
jgi:hypothetical protein